MPKSYTQLLQSLDRKSISKSQKLKEKLKEKLQDMTMYGVANVSHYPNIAECYSEDHPDNPTWMQGVLDRGKPDFSEEQKIYQSFTAGGRVSQSSRPDRRSLASVGHAMSKAPVGACTIHAISAANRILSLQESGELPAEMSIRIMSGKHKADKSDTDSSTTSRYIRESHLIVVLDMMPEGKRDDTTFNDYLKSNVVSEQSIVIDTWYGAQGGEYVMSPSYFQDEVGNYLSSGPEVEVDTIYHLACRTPDKLQEDKEIAEAAAGSLDNTVAQIMNRAESSVEEEPVFTQFMADYGKIARDFETASPEEKSDLHRVMGLENGEEILFCKNLDSEDFNIKIKTNDKIAGEEGKFKSRFITKNDFIDMLKANEPETKLRI